jgi:hypothetical protein
MRVTPRDRQVQKWRAGAASAVSAAWDATDLSAVEFLQVLTEFQASVLRELRRTESEDAEPEDAPLEYRGLPTHVRFAHPDAGYQTARENAHAALEAGAVYVLQRLSVGQSSSYVTLYGVSGTFGAEFFEPYELTEALTGDGPGYQPAGEGADGDGGS